MKPSNRITSRPPSSSTRSAATRSRSTNQDSVRSQRLGITEPEVPALRAVLERAVPKNRGAEFLDLIEDLTNDTCIEGEPDCPRCELRKICTFAHESQDGASAAQPVMAQVKR